MYKPILNKTIPLGWEICEPQGLDLQEAILGNICLLCPIHTLILGLDSWPQSGTE